MSVLTMKIEGHGDNCRSGVAGAWSHSRAGAGCMGRAALQILHQVRSVNPEAPLLEGSDRGASYTRRALNRVPVHDWYQDP